MKVTDDGHLVAENRKDLEAIHNLIRSGWSESSYKPHSVKIPKGVRIE